MKIVKTGNHHYGGKYFGIGNKWFFCWFSDYRKSSIVKTDFQFEIGSKFFNTKILQIKLH